MSNLGYTNLEKIGDNTNVDTRILIDMIKLDVDLKALCFSQYPNASKDQIMNCASKAKVVREAFNINMAKIYN